jgi:hypothetical protein
MAVRLKCNKCKNGYLMELVNGYGCSHCTFYVSYTNPSLVVGLFKVVEDVVGKPTNSIRLHPFKIH